MNIGFYAKGDQIELAYTCYYSIQAIDSKTSITILFPKDHKDIYENRFVDSSVKLIDLDIPYLLFECPFMDKLYAASIYEKLVGKFVWIDVDSYFLQSMPKQSFTHQIALNPVDIKNIGQTTINPIDDYWKLLLETININEDTYTSRIIETTISKEHLYPYYNMGFVMISDNKYVFSLALDVFYKVMENKGINQFLEKSFLYAIFLHQVLFSLSVIKLYFDEEITMLPKHFNYPLHLQHKDREPVELDKLYHFRYDDFFNKPDKMILSKLPKYLQLNHKLLKQ